MTWSGPAGRGGRSSEWPDVGVNACLQEEFVQEASPDAFAGGTPAFAQC